MGSPRPLPDLAPQFRPFIVNEPRMNTNRRELWMPIRVHSRFLKRRRSHSKPVDNFRQAQRDLRGIAERSRRFRLLSSPPGFPCGIWLSCPVLFENLPGEPADQLRFFRGQDDPSLMLCRLSPFRARLYHAGVPDVCTQGRDCRPSECWKKFAV